MADMDFDVIIVGGGVIGCSSGFFLSRQGLKVAVLEQGNLAEGTTSNSFAWINATSKTAEADYHHLNALGLAGYNELAAEFGQETLGINPVGALKIVRQSDAASYATTRDQANTLGGYGYSNRWIETAELRQLEPRLVLPDDAEALLTPADHCLNAPHFARFMAAKIEARGGRLFENCRAQALIADDDGQVRGIESEAGKLSANKVLIAAGPHTPEVLGALTGYDGFAARFPMRRVPGLLVTTPATAAPQAIRHVVYFASGPELHFLPDFNGGLKLGADETDGMIEEGASLERQRQAAKTLLNRARSYLPDVLPEADVLREDYLDACTLAIGVRPYPNDGRSLAGALPGSKGLFVIATHSGITLAPALGRLMAELMTTGQTPDALAPFVLERFAGFNS
jgi:glycine/D-amino acid oxidase-like deaminating enzyme